MMPISLAHPCENLTIKKVAGSEKMQMHLHNLGFIEGEPIMIVNKIHENVIVKIKGVSLAITYELAKKIYV